MGEPLPPYLAAESELQTHIEQAVDFVFSELSSQFMLLPRGVNFLGYDAFQEGYEALRINTDGFAALTAESCWTALREDARAWIVLRAIMGISPPEWGELANELEHKSIPTNWCRSIDGDVKKDRDLFNESRSQPEQRRQRVDLCIRAAVKAINEGAEPLQTDDLLHRLDKFDTAAGHSSVEHASLQGVPYPVLLYERILGRPFASHRDSVSELVGDEMETAIEGVLTAARIPFRKTRRAERVPGFEQAPDFFIPDEITPAVIIEAKVCGDDGTARDKVSRVLRLAQMRDLRQQAGKTPYELVACIDGRGFSVRRQDMRDLLLATNGKVFTMSTLDNLIDSTTLRKLKPQEPRTQ